MKVALCVTLLALVTTFATGQLSPRVAPIPPSPVISGREASSGGSTNSSGSNSSIVLITEESTQDASNMKIMSICVITGIAWTVDALVLFFPGVHKHPGVLSVISCFSAGMFSVIAICHLLPEGTDGFAEHYKNDPETVSRYRPAEITALSGYFIMLFLQKGLFNVKEHHGAAPSSEEEEEEEEMHQQDKKSKKSKNKKKKAAAKKKADEKKVQQKKKGKKKVSPKIVVDEDDDEEEKFSSEPATGGSESPISQQQVETDGETFEEENQVSTATPSDSDRHSSDDGNGVVITEPAAVARQKKEAKKKKAAAKAITGELVNLGVLFTTLFVHGTIEGIALGLQSTREGVLVLFVAIVVHHWGEDLIFTFSTSKIKKPKTDTDIIAVSNEPTAVSGEVVSAKYAKREPYLPRHVRGGIAFLCSCNAALGISIGWGIQSAVPAVVDAYIVSFCAGTFSYFAFSEIVPEEMTSGSGRKLPQLLAFFIGMAVLYSTLAGMYEQEPIA